MDQLNLVLDAVFAGLRLLLSFWWVWLPIALGVAAYKAWFEHQREKYIAGIKWVMIEVIPPPDVPFSTAKAAENIFSGLHATYAGFPGTTWKTQFFQGKVPVSFSFEIVSEGGQTHFFIRCPQDQRNTLEVLIFAQYPEAEIRVVPDYIQETADELELSTHDILGAELEFTKEQAYPIKTYVEFEEAGGKDEYSRLDPIAPLVEIMSVLQPGEHLWLQYVIRATGSDWVAENKKVVDKLMGKPDKPSELALIEQILILPFTLLEMLLVEIGVSTPPDPKKEEKVEFNLQKLTASQRKVLESVEYKLAKLAFKTGIRLVYTAPKESFNASRITAVTGMFKQLYYNNLNSFKPVMTSDKGVLKWLFPGGKGFFTDSRTIKKKKKMYKAYRDRLFPEKEDKEMLCILNTEELATLWHLPAINVRAPLLPRVQAKKGQPPAILPTR